MCPGADYKGTKQWSVGVAGAVLQQDYGMDTGSVHLAELEMDRPGHFKVYVILSVNKNPRTLLCIS